ncbi:MAG: hypothetical protein V1774_12285 [Candidatus Eisenbacteria bacterium]
MFFNRDSRRQFQLAEGPAPAASAAFPATSPDADELLLAKIVALLRTLPFEPAGEEDDREVVSSDLPRLAPVHRLAGGAADDARGICMNLITLSQSFARLSDQQLLGVAQDTRARARGELIGVWKMLDLLERMEATKSQLLAEEC